MGRRRDSGRCIRRGKNAVVSLLLLLLKTSSATCPLADDSKRVMMMMMMMRCAIPGRLFGVNGVCGSCCTILVGDHDVVHINILASHLSRELPVLGRLVVADETVGMAAKQGMALRGATRPDEIADKSRNWFDVAYAVVNKTQGSGAHEKRRLVGALFFVVARQCRWVVILRKLLAHTLFAAGQVCNTSEEMTPCESSMREHHRMDRRYLLWYLIIIQVVVPGVNLMDRCVWLNGRSDTHGQAGVGHNCSLAAVVVVFVGGGVGVIDIDPGLD